METHSECAIDLTVDQVLKDLDDRRIDVVSGNGMLHRSAYGLCAWIPYYLEALPKIRNANGRMHILFWLRSLARKDSRVVGAAIERLNDKSAVVRMYACEILAYSLREDAIASLEELLHHPSARTRDEAAAAIDAIRHKNHHYYLDRTHSGSTFWVLNPEDDPHYKPRRWQKAAV